MTAGTFAAYHVAGTSTDINDPIANWAASVNYMEHVHHVNADGSNLAAQVQEADPNRRPRGYEIIGTAWTGVGLVILAVLTRGFRKPTMTLSEV